MIRKTKMKAMKIYRWECNNPEHSHTTKHVAQRCIDKSMRKKAFKRTNEDYHRIAIMFLSGASVQDIADSEGVGNSRGRRILMETVRLMMINGGRDLLDSGVGLFADTKKIAADKNNTPTWLAIAERLIKKDPE